MPSLRIHCAISKKRTGKSYGELHNWIDDNKKDRGVDHRKKNHHYTTKLKNYISHRFGGAEAISEWLFHIALDNLDTYITNEWDYNKHGFNFIKFGFSESGFIYCDEGDLDEKTLEKEFERL